MLQIDHLQLASPMVLTLSNDAAVPHAFYLQRALALEPGGADSCTAHVRVTRQRKADIHEKELQNGHH